VGGYTGRAGQTVRWHRLYRAEDLSRATNADLAGLGHLGIRTVIDLRSDREASTRPTPPLPGSVDRHHLPLLRDGWRPRGTDLIVGRGGREATEDRLVELYLEMLVEGSPAIADALALLASPSAYPVLVHSAFGKDRAGLLIAVVLGLLAVHDESIAEDYGTSETMLATAEPDRWFAGSCLDDALIQFYASVGSPPDAMARFLERIRDRARSMVGFARSIGVPFESVEALHQNLLS